MSPAKKLGKKKRSRPAPEEVLRATAAEPELKRRSSKFDRAVAEEIAHRIACGASGAEVCRDPDMPDWPTVVRWRRQHKWFDEIYLQAQQMQHQYWAEQILDIADHTETGTKTQTQEWGTSVTRADMLEHRKLKIDARKWLLSKLVRATYGDRTAVTGHDDGPIGLKLETKDDLIASIIGLVKPKKDGIEKPNKGKREK